MRKRSVVERLCRRFGIARVSDTPTREALREALGLQDKYRQQVVEKIRRRAHDMGEMLERHERQVTHAHQTIEQLQATVSTLQQHLAEARRHAELLLRSRKRDLAALESMHRTRDELHAQAEAVAGHLDCVVGATTVRDDPFPHAVIEGVLPNWLYDRALNSLPSPEYWQSGGRAREYWEIESDIGPWETEAVWGFVDRLVVETLLKDRVLALFRPHLDEHWRSAFGVVGDTVGYEVGEGRLQRRRRGYTLRAHLDPPHAALTGLLYLARPGDDPAHGTSLYRPLAQLPMKREGIYFPEDHGIPLERVATVPFRPNTLLLWMTSLGAHGAELTGKAVPADVERFTYQFQFVVDRTTRRAIESN